MKVVKMETSTPQDWHESDKNNGLVNKEDIGSEARFSISKQDGLILLAMASLSLMAAVDGTSISVALPVLSYPKKNCVSRDNTES
jgi:hypothetical protein